MSSFENMRYVAAGGAGGGVVSWLYSITVGTPFPLPAVGAIAACAFLGAVAAFISVYLVANSDTKNLPRLIAFALVCGICWKPVIDSSVTFVNQKRDAAAAGVTSQAAIEKLQAAPTQQQPAVVVQATNATTELLKTSRTLRDPVLTRQADQRARELITQVDRTAATNPQSAAVALTQVRDAAIATNNPELARVASAKLERLSVRPPAH